MSGIFQNLFQPLLGISCCISFSLPPRALPSVGPAVGPGGIAPARLQARNLDAVPNSVSHDVIMLGHFAHTGCFCHFLPSDAVGKAPNQLRMVVDRPNRDEMVRYRGARNYQILHRSAAKLWSHGVQMGTALKIIREAVAESGG